MIQLSLKTIVALIIVTIVILVAATCVGVYLGLAVESMKAIGEGYAASLGTGVADNVLQYFKTQDAIFTNIEAFAKSSANQLPSIMKANGQNWTMPWKSAATSILSHRNFSLTSVSVLFTDHYWLTFGLSFLESGSAGGAAKSPGERTVILEWIEDLTGGGNPLTMSVGGERWLVREDFSNPFDRAIRPDPTYGVPETLAQGISLKPTDNPEFSTLWALLEGRRCIFLGFMHGNWARLNNYWNAVIGCRNRNVSDVTIGWTMGVISMTSDISAILAAAPRSPTGHNIIIDSSPFIVSTTPGLPPFFTSKEDSTLTPSTPEPDGCSNSEKLNPGIFKPPRMGCRKSPSQFEYAPIPALHGKNPGFFVSDGAVEEVTGADTSDGNSYLAAVKKINLDTINLRLFVVAVVPFEDIFGDDIATAIGVSVALTLLVAALATVVTWGLLSHFLSGLEDLQREMEDAARMGSGGAEDDKEDEEAGSSPASLSGWAAVFGAMHDGDMDVHNLDSNNDDDEPPPSSSGRNSSGSLQQHVAGGSSSSSTDERRRQRHADMAPSAVAEGAQEMVPVEVQRVEQDSSNSSTRRRRGAPMSVTPASRQAGGSIIQEIAAVELAYKTAIAALRRSTAFVPQQLLAAELLHQRRLAKAAAKKDAEDEEAHAADVWGGGGATAGTAAIENVSRTDDDMVLAANIPPSKNEVSILLIQLEQMGKIQSYVSPPPADDCDSDQSESNHSIDLERSQDATSLLQLYFKRVTRCVMSHGGIVHSFAGCGSEESAMMATWGAPIQREDHSVLAVLCALSILREAKKEAGRLRALCERVLGTTELRVRIAITSGVSTTGCVRDPDGRIRYCMYGGPVATGSRLLAAGRRWRVPCIVDEHTAKPAEGMVTCRLLCLAKIKNADSPSYIYEPIGVDAESAVVVSIQRGKLARDAVVAAQRRNILKRGSNSSSSSGPPSGLISGSFSSLPAASNESSLKSPIAAGAQHPSDVPSSEDSDHHALDFAVDAAQVSSGLCSATSDENNDTANNEEDEEEVRDAQQYNRVMRHVYGTHSGGGNNDDDDDQTDLSLQQEQGAVSLQLSDAMSVNTIHASDNRGLAEVLVPSSASVERLLRWHADGRTTFDAAYRAYCDAFSFAARDVVNRDWQSAARRLGRIEADARFVACLQKDAGTLAVLKHLVEIFLEATTVHARNLCKVGDKMLFVDLMRGNPDAIF